MPSHSPFLLAILDAHAAGDHSLADAVVDLAHDAGIPHADPLGEDGADHVEQARKRVNASLYRHLGWKVKAEPVQESAVAVSTSDFAGHQMLQATGKVKRTHLEAEDAPDPSFPDDSPAPDHVANADRATRYISQVLSGSEAFQAGHLIEALDGLDEEGIERVRMMLPGIGGEALTESAEWDEKKHKRDHGKFASKQGGDGGEEDGADDDEEDEEPESEPFEWDGTIDDDRVDEDRRPYERAIATWNYNDGIEDYGNSVHLLHGTYDTNPDDDDSDVVDVWRWASHDDNSGDPGEHGEWTTDEGEARQQGENFAEENHEEPEEEEPEEAEEDEDDEEEDGYYDPSESWEDDLSPYKTPKKTIHGKSAARVEVKDTNGDEMVAKLFPKANGNLEECYKSLASSVGAPDDAEILVTYAGPYKKLYTDDTPLEAEGIRIHIKHPKLDTAIRFLGIDSDGRRMIRNEIVEVKKAHQKEGIGLALFSRQVENAIDEGFDYISTHAAGGPGEAMNGYYTWARFGYNEPLSSIDKRNRPIAKKIQKEFPEAKSIRDVMATPEGRDWWKENGGDLYDARFDLREGSWSRLILDAYMEERAKKEK